MPCLAAALLLMVALLLSVRTVLLLAIFAGFLVAAKVLLVSAIGEQTFLTRWRTYGRMLDPRIPRWSAPVVLLTAFVLLVAYSVWAGLDSPQLQEFEWQYALANPQIPPARARLMYRAYWVASRVGLGVIWFFVVGGVLVVLRTSGLTSLVRRSGRTHGTAHFEALQKEWGDRSAAVAALLVLRPALGAAATRFVRPFLGYAHARLAYLTWEQLSRHLLIVGATGARKTTGVFTHLMLSSEVPWIYQDQKAELPLRDRFPDRPVWGLDTRGYQTRSGVWNPMEEIREPEDAQVLAALLFPDRGDQNDWVVRSARYIFEDLLTTQSIDSIQGLAWILQNEPPDRLLQRLPEGWRTTMADARQRGYFVQALLEALRPWTGARIAKVTHGKSTVRLDEFIARGGYVLCNEDKHLRQPVTLFWGMLLHRLRNRSDAAGRLLLLFDEFGDAGKIPNMAQALALYRSKGVGIVAGIQTYSLMKTVYGPEWEAVRDGFGSVFLLTANMPREQYEPLTRQLGQYTEEHDHLSAGGQGPGISSGHRVAANLVPVDQWPEWSAHAACLARGHYPTWWVPVSVSLAPAPADLAEASADTDWRAEERARLSALKPSGPAPAPADTSCQKCGGPVSTAAPCPWCGASPHSVESWKVF